MMKKILLFVAVFVAGAYFGKPIIDNVLKMFGGFGRSKTPVGTASVDTDEMITNEKI